MKLKTKEPYKSLIKKRLLELEGSFDGRVNFSKFLSAYFSSAQTLWGKWIEAGNIPGESVMRISTALKSIHYPNTQYYDPYYLRPDLADPETIEIKYLPKEFKIVEIDINEID